MDLRTMLKEYWPIIALALAFLIVNVVNIEDYGISTDEPTQRLIGQANLDYLSGKTNNISLEYDFIYYGPFFEVLNTVCANILKRTTNLSDVAAHHFLGIIVSTIGIIILYLFTKKIYGKNIALYAAIFFAFFPQFIAHTHYNTKDIPVMIFSLITIYMLYLAFKEKNYKYILSAGILFGITIDTKISGLLVLPIFFVPYVLDLLVKRELLNKQVLKRELKLVSIFTLAAALSIFVFWPALWHAPDLFVKTILYFFHHNWNLSILYIGQYYNNDTLPRHYAVIELLIATPTVTIICLLLGIYLSISRSVSKEKVFDNLLILFWFFLPLFLEIKPGTIIYDGIRHFFIILPSLAIFSGIGFEKIIQTINDKYPNYDVRKALTIIVLGILLVNVAEIHPYEGSYVNEITRTLIPEHIEYWFEIEYWGPTYKNGIEWLNKNAIYGSAVYAPVNGHLIDFNDLRPDLKHVWDEQNADYFMTITKAPYNLRDDEEIRNFGEPVYKISKYNSDLLYIFKTHRIRYEYDMPFDISPSMLGWYDPELWNNIPTYWMPADAFSIINSTENGTANLSLQALTFYRNRTLEVYNGDTLEANFSVPSRTAVNVNLPIHLEKGVNILRIHVPEGCERPIDKQELNSTDFRCLSMAVQKMTLKDGFEHEIYSNVTPSMVGWHIPENWDNTTTYWMQADAFTVANSPDNLTANLRFSALSFYRNRTLEIYNGDVLLAKIAVPSNMFIDVNLPIHLEKGVNILHIHVPEGCERPIDKQELKSIDSRCLSIAVQNMSLIIA